MASHQEFLTVTRLRAVALRLVNGGVKYLSDPDAEDLSLPLAVLLFEAAAKLDCATNVPGMLADGRLIDDVWPKALAEAMTQMQEVH